jgi:hypothetical protein
VREAGLEPVLRAENSSSFAEIQTEISEQIPEPETVIVQTGVIEEVIEEGPVPKHKPKRRKITSTTKGGRSGKTRTRSPKERSKESGTSKA